MRFNRFDFHFLSVVALLFSAALMLQGRSKKEIIPARLPLSQFPRDLGSWAGTDVSIDKETLDVLGPGDFLLRVYQNQLTPEPSVDLFVAYFPSQRAGDTIHSPKNCLPGAGWRAVDSRRITLSFPGAPSFPANRYLIARGEERELVVYWYQAHDRALASEYWAKFYLIADAIRMNRSDGSLIRLATPLMPRERVEDVDNRVFRLATQVVPLLNSYVPR
ncbi:MAG TPA: EpsI family protein [Terriglobales bacterium]